MEKRSRNTLIIIIIIILVLGLYGVRTRCVVVSAKGKGVMVGQEGV